MSKSNLRQSKTKLLCVLGVFWLVLFAVLHSKAERLPLKLYNSADGLASGAIFQVERDSRGFLWFATRDGLSRFDGREFVNYRLEGKEDAPTFNAVLETRDGAFWLSASGGLYRVEPNEAAAVEKAASETNLYKIIRAERVADVAPSVLFEDSRGRVWGAGSELILIRENGETKVENFDLGEIARVRNMLLIGAISEGRDGSLWVGCAQGAMRIAPDKRRVLYPIRRLTGYDETRSIVEDAAGRIWVGHSTGVFVFQPETLDELTNAPDLSVRAVETNERIVAADAAADDSIVLPNQPGAMLRLMFPEEQPQTKDAAGNFGKRQTANISRIFKSSDGKIWIPAGGNLFVFDAGNYRRYSDSNGFSGLVTDIAEDADGDILLATEGGALRFDRAGLTSYAAIEGLQDPRVHSIHETANGELFAVHGDWRVSRIADGGIESGRLNVPDGDRFMWTSTVALLDRRRGEWRALTTNGLYQFPAAQDLARLGAEKPRRVVGQKDGFSSDLFYAAFADSRGNLWFSTRGTAAETGLARLDAAANEWRFFNLADGFPANAAVRAFAEDRNGNVWCGFYGGGLARFDGARFDDFSKQENFPKGGILGLYFDARGRLWIATTQSGLILVENPNVDRLEFVAFTTAQGLASNNIRAVTGDFSGNIYAGTIRGVDRLNPETGAVRHYSTAHGLASDAVTVAFTDRRGRVWFGTQNGLSRLEPENEIASTGIAAAPQIFINNLQIAGMNREISIFGQREIAEVELNADENNLNIGYTGVGDNLRFQYKLESGASGTDWSRPTTERAVNFAGLAPGDYSFSVRAVNAENRASDSPARISFSVAPPFWKTWQFIFSIFAAAAASVFLLDRYRVAKTRQVESALVKSQTAEKATKESETRFRTLAETASDAIITIDEQSRIIFVNPAVEKIFGYRAEELVGENLTMLMPEKMRSHHDAGFGRYLKTNRKNLVWNGIELPGQHKSGMELPIEVSFGEFERDGRRYFTGIIRDISERRRAEEALQAAREERIKELQKVRTRIATDLHDDIGSSLTQISVLTEVARASAVLETVKSPLERISNVSNELVDAMADIVWAINPKKDSLRELVLRMRRFASDVLSARDIEFELDAPEDLDGVQLGANIRREVFSIFKECVNNVVRHSQAREVLIEFVIADDILRLKIKDDGRGFDVERILSEGFAPDKGGNGLINMRRRASELGGTCEIVSGASGTITTLKIPLHLTPAGDDIHITQTGGANGGAPIHTDSDGASGNDLH